MAPAGAGCLRLAWQHQEHLLTTAMTGSAWMTEALSDLTSLSHTLYRFYDATGQLLYVGITVNAANRWGQHSWSKSWWTQVAKVTVEHFDSRNAVEAAEIAAIRAEKPLHNVMYNSRRPQRVRTPRVGPRDIRGLPTGQPMFVRRLHLEDPDPVDELGKNGLPSVENVLRRGVELPPLPVCALDRSDVTGEWFVEIRVGKPIWDGGSGFHPRWATVTIPVSDERGEELAAARRRQARKPAG